MTLVLSRNDDILWSVNIDAVHFNRRDQGAPVNHYFGLCRYKGLNLKEIKQGKKPLFCKKAAQKTLLLGPWVFEAQKQKGVDARFRGHDGGEAQTANEQKFFGYFFSKK